MTTHVTTKAAIRMPSPTPVQPSRRSIAKGAAWSVPMVTLAGAAPALAASPTSTPCDGLRLVKTNGLTDPEVFTTVSAGSITSSGGTVAQEGYTGTIWIPSAQCGCGIKDLALHYSVPCPNSATGSVDCANPQVRQVALSVSGGSTATSIAYLANPYDYGCRTRNATWTATTDGGVGLQDPEGGYYSRFLFHNQFEGGNCGLLRLTGTAGTATLTARTSLNMADGQNCYDENLQFEVKLTIVVGGTQPAGSVRMNTECSCV